MNTNVRRVVVLLALVLVAGMLYANGQQQTTTTSQQPKTITFVADNMINDAMGLQAVLNEFYKLTGTKLEVTIPPHQQYPAKLQVMATSGDLPDVWQVWSPLDITFARQGVDIPLDSFIKSSKNISRMNPSYFVPYTVGGKIYGVPTDGGGGTVTYIRKDWLDKLGLPVPKTLDDMISVAKAFTKDDPNGDGKNDTYGYTSLIGNDGVSPYYWPNLLQGAVPDFVKVNGKWVDGFTMPNMKAAIQRIRQGYVDGWIDPDIFTNSTGTARDKFTHGTAGMFTYWSGAWGPAMQTLTVQGSGPKADVVALPALSNANYWNRAAVPQAITVKAKDPKFVFDTLLDNMWDQGPIEFLFIHGVEGVHWKSLGNGKDVALPALNNPKATFSKVYIHPELAILPLKNDPFTYAPRLFSSEKARKSNMKQFYVPSGGDVYAKNIGDLQALRSEVFAKIIAGQMTMDQGYAYYDQKAKALQISVMEQELDKS